MNHFATQTRDEAAMREALAELHTQPNVWRRRAAAAEAHDFSALIGREPVKPIETVEGEHPWLDWVYLVAVLAGIFASYYCARN